MLQLPNMIKLSSKKVFMQHKHGSSVVNYFMTIARKKNGSSFCDIFRSFLSSIELIQISIGAICLQNVTARLNTPMKRSSSDGR